MAKQTCPKCATQFPTGNGWEGWAKTTLSLLVPAPAVPDMATQVRCPHCGHLFAESEVRHLAPWGKLSRVLFIIACVGAVVWAVYQLF